MRNRIHSHPFIHLLIIPALLLIFATPVFADDNNDESEVRPRRRLDREILMELGRKDESGGVAWSWLKDGKLKIRGKGLQYRKRFRANNRPFEMKVEGPKVKGGWGFKFQIEF